MPDIDRDISEQIIPLYPVVKPTNQKLHRIKPKWALKIKKKDVQRQLDGSFINITPVPLMGG